MTAKQIIKVLECCVLDTGDCNKSPLVRNSDCMDKIPKEALKLINRQKAEIKRLKKDYKYLEEQAEAVDNVLEEEYKDKTQLIDTERRNAIEEFCEQLKNEIISDTAYGCDYNQHTGYYDNTIKIGDIIEYIDDLLKKITEVQDWSDTE